MKSFKEQNKDEVFKGNNNITIDAKHREINNYFKNKKKNLPELENNLVELINKYNSFENECLDKKQCLLKIKEIKKEIKDIKNNKDEINYYLDVGNILNSYYENSSTDNDNKKVKKDKELLPKKKTKKIENATPITNFFQIQDTKSQLDKKELSVKHTNINNVRKEQTLVNYN